MKRSRKFISMPIVSLEEGLQIGTVRSLVVDSAKMEIAALVVDQQGWFREQKIIPFTKVRSVGNDAITVDQSSSAQRTISLPEILKLMKERANPLGTRVIVENGTVLGTVDEYYIDEATGKITDLEISGKFLESLFKGKATLSTEHVRTMGGHAIIVKEGAESYLQKIDGGFQETIQNIKEGTSNLWESTKQRTWVIGKNIKDKYEKKEKTTSSAEQTDETLPTEPSDSQLEPNPNLDVISEVEIKKEEVLPSITEAEHPQDTKSDIEQTAGSQKK